MKTVCSLLLSLLVLVSVCAAQQPAAPTAQPGQPIPRTDVYHVHFAKAAVSKVAELGDFLKKQDPKAPMPGHYLVLRHQEGDDWDYAVIEHLGTKATVDAAGTPLPPNALSLYSWHTDTFVNGPAWAEFSRALGLGAPSMANAANAVYVVGMFRAAPGPRTELEKLLSTPPGGSGGQVLMQHLEGGPWQFLTIARYNSWQDFANGEASGIAQTRTGASPWFQLRDHITFHRDTVADRMVP